MTFIKTISKADAGLLNIAFNNNRALRQEIDLLIENALSDLLKKK